MDPFTEQTVRQLQQFSCNRWRSVFENGQEGIIAIDIQDGYDKFNDNVKNTFDSSQDLNITINEDVFTSNESQAQAEGNGLFEKIL
jgi:PAS domain-containing protein